MSELETNLRQINVIRLEGQINDIKKVIYLFADVHADVTQQTAYRNIFAKDVSRYMADNFLKLNKESKLYDFFVEIDPDELLQPKSNNPDIPQLNYKEKYIVEIIKLFQKIFTFDLKKNKILTSKILKNIRLHYADIRNYFHVVFSRKMTAIGNATHDIWHNGIRL